MSLKVVKCPNCTAPVKPEPNLEILFCGYCNHHFENPIYRKPGTGTSVPVKVDVGAKITRSVLLFYLLPSSIGLIIAIVVVLGVAVRSSQTVTNTTSTTITIPSFPNVSQANNAAQHSSPDIALEMKLDKYIDCLEFAFPRAAQSMDRYRSWVDMKKGPTCKERYVSWGLYAMYKDAPKRCQEYVGTANAAEPQLPSLHQAAIEFYTAAAALEPVMAAASEYYDKKMYSVDDCEKGRALHPQLVALFDNFIMKQQVLRQNIEHFSKGALERCLTRTAADPGAAAAYQWALLMKTAGGMIEAFRAESQKKKPSEEIIKNHIAAVSGVAGALDAVSDKHKEAAGYDWSKKNDIDSFIAGAVAFLKSKGGQKLNSTARFFRRNGSPLKTLDGTFENLQVRYNAILEDYGRNTFCGTLLSCTEDRCPVR